MLKISIIIPCFNDEQVLLRLLAQLRALPHAPFQIIVVDGASSESCKNICQQYQAIRLTSEPCRGKQLLAGAAIAEGNVLWFLHADAHLPQDSMTTITAAITKGAVGGYFKFRFNEPRGWAAKMLEPAIALRCRLGVPYGDQGLFVSKDAYFKAQGHAPWPLFEEVPLVKNIRRLGSFIALGTPILVDSRRWQHDGWWHRTWENRKLALAFIFGCPPVVLAKKYRSHLTNFKQD